MKKYIGMHKGDIYVSEISDSVYGGCNLRIMRIRQGRDPKPYLSKYCKSNFDAKMEMEKHFPDVEWKED